MSDRQPPIPGLEMVPASLLQGTRHPQKSSAQPVEELRLIKKRITSLEMEFSILKIQLEKDYA